MNKEVRNRMKGAFLDELNKSKVGGNVDVACTRLGYVRKTVYAWKKADAKFEAEWNDIVFEWKSRKADEAEDGLRKLVLKEHPTAIIFTLKNTRPKEWKDRSEIEHVEKRFKDYGEYKRYCEENGINPDTGLRVSSGSSSVEQSTGNKDIS